MQMQILVGGVLLLAAFVSGIKVEGWRRDAQEKAKIEKAIALKEKELDKIEAVSFSYQQMTAELRRVQTGVNKEIYRETEKVEYRCPVPASASVLINRAVEAANTAAAGPAVPVPTGPGDDGK